MQLLARPTLQVNQRRGMTMSRYATTSMQWRINMFYNPPKRDIDRADLLLKDKRVPYHRSINCKICFSANNILYQIFERFFQH